MVKEWIKIVIHSFCRITTGIVFATFLSCLIFTPNATFSIVFFEQVLLLALITSVFGLILHPSQEPSKKMWIFRSIAHFLLLIIFVVSFAKYCGWIDNNNWFEVGFIAGSVILVYAVMKVTAYWGDKKEADKILNGVKRYRERNTK